MRHPTKMIPYLYTTKWGFTTNLFQWTDVTSKLEYLTKLNKVNIANFSDNGLEE